MSHNYQQNYFPIFTALIVLSDRKFCHYYIFILFQSLPLLSLLHVFIHYIFAHRIHQANTPSVNRDHPSMISICSSVLPSIHSLSIHPFINPCIHLFIDQNPSFYLFIHPSFNPSILYIYSFLHLFIHPSFLHPSILVYIYSLIQLSILLFVHTSIIQSIHIIYLFIPPSIHPSIHPSLHPSLYPSIHRSNYPSFYSFIHPSFHPSVLYIYSSIHPSIYSSTHPSILPSIHLSINQSSSISRLLLAYYKTGILYCHPSTAA